MNASRPFPVTSVPAALCRDLQYLFADIDDTLTTDGMLLDSSYSALWHLNSAGIKVIPVTGRPAGWCDHIARMWPVAGVVGENGAFVYSYDRTARKMRRRFLMDTSADRERLTGVAARVLKRVPGAALAADQPFRISDIAIDYCEDVQRLDPAKVDGICDVLREEGVQFKVSSIHVNFWIGDFDKLSGARVFMQEDAGSPLSTMGEKAIFIGDSPNDEPLFEGFPHSIAVGNIRGFLPRIRHLPEFITSADCAAGFREAVQVILRNRA